jgi:FkbM family methyltransferase
MGLLDRAGTFIRKRRNALDLGIPLVRSQDFELPKQVKLNGRLYPLNLPDGQAAIKIDFSDLLFNDAYSLGAVPRPVRFIVDIGGNVGLFCLAARRAFPDAQIHTYEPNMALTEYLKTQAQTTDARYFPEAVGSRDGTVRLNAQDESVTSTTSFSEEGDTPCVSLRRCVERIGGQIDLLKLDCEGAEWEIFTDPEPFKNIRSIVMEYHLTDNKTVTDVQSTMTGLGYQVTHFTGPFGEVGMLAATRA